MKDWAVYIKKRFGNMYLGSVSAATEEEARKKAEEKFSELTYNDVVYYVQER